MQTGVRAAVVQADLKIRWATLLRKQPGLLDAVKNGSQSVQHGTPAAMQLPAAAQVDEHMQLAYAGAWILWATHVLSARDVLLLSTHAAAIALLQHGCGHPNNSTSHCETPSHSFMPVALCAHRGCRRCGPAQRQQCARGDRRQPDWQTR